MEYKSREMESQHKLKTGWDDVTVGLCRVEEMPLGRGGETQQRSSQAQTSAGNCAEGLNKKTAAVTYRDVVKIPRGCEDEKECVGACSKVLQNKSLQLNLQSCFALK